MTGEVGVLRTAAGMSEAIVGPGRPVGSRGQRGGTSGLGDHQPADHRPRWPRRPDCGPRPAARTGARTSRCATTSTGPATSTSLWSRTSWSSSSCRPPGLRPREGALVTSLSDVPAALLDELTAAGLDPEAIWEIIAGALREDLPDPEMDDPTSSSTIAPDARGEAVFGAPPGSRGSSPVWAWLRSPSSWWVPSPRSRAGCPTARGSRGVTWSCASAGRPSGCWSPADARLSTSRAT